MKENMLFGLFLSAGILLLPHTLRLKTKNLKKIFSLYLSRRP